MKNQIKVALVATAGGAAIAAALSGAGSANASCASINGVNSGGDCISTPGSVAIGLGRNAKATAEGPMNIAVAVGNPGPNPFYKDAMKNDVVLPTLAFAKGAFNGSFAIGNGSNAGSYGLGNSAIVVGSGSNAYSYGGSLVDSPSSLNDYRQSHFNTSIVLGDRSEAGAVGRRPSLATAFGNDKQDGNNGLRPARSRFAPK